MVLFNSQNLRDEQMRRLWVTLFCFMSICAFEGLTAKAAVVLFGSGVNQFAIDFVPIGSPGNAGDPVPNGPTGTGMIKPFGSVAYEYQIAKYEISREIIEKYNADFGATNSMQIELADMRFMGGDHPGKPATGASWNEAARFVNWLNTSQNFSPAYYFPTGGVNDDVADWSPLLHPLDYDPANPVRSRRAKYVLPTFDERYKATFYDPTKDGTGGYWTYASSSDSVPIAVASGTSPNTLVYAQTFEQGPALVDQAGGLNAFGVMGMGGNVYEFEESIGTFTTNGIPYRGLYSGRWNGEEFQQSRDFRGMWPAYARLAGSANIGFRVVSLSGGGGGGGKGVVPEPGTIWIVAAMGLPAYARWRKTRRLGSGEEMPFA
jgi:hypothetical protein